MLYQDAEKAFDGAIESAVHHERLVLFAIFPNVFQIETFGQGEIELHRGKLPEAADGVDQLDVDFGTIEGRFIGDALYFQAEAAAGIFAGGLGELPLLGIADILTAYAVIPGRKFRFVLGETKGI